MAQYIYNVKKNPISLNDWYSSSHWTKRNKQKKEWKSLFEEVISNNKNAIFIKNFTKPISWKYEIQKIKNQPHKHLIMSRNNYELSRTYTLNSRAKKILDGI